MSADRIVYATAVSGPAGLASVLVGVNRAGCRTYRVHAPRLLAVSGGYRDDNSPIPFDEARDNALAIARETASHD